MFYYQQFFRTALDGIDRSNIMPVTVQVGQVILLVSFLVAVYESFIRGGDVRMLGIAAVRYVALGLVLLAPSRPALVAWALIWLGLELQVRAVEEPHLARVHGEPYRSYLREVGRFVPGIGKRSPRGGAGEARSEPQTSEEESV